jgi:hypothetical protein
MKPEIIIFTRVGRRSGVRPLYEGYCSKCDKVRYHRLDGGTIYDSSYRCIGCGNITTVPKKIST